MAGSKVLKRVQNTWLTHKLVTNLDHNEASLTKSRTLHRVCSGSPGIPLVEIKIIGHFKLQKETV